MNDPFVPDYEGGRLAEFTWLLKRIGVGLGISINPSWSVGIDMAPEMEAPPLVPARVVCVTDEGMGVQFI